ncbi:sulfatase [Maribacter sp. 2307ULW6-5]|uniref:sulfatase n=1 Tax=Maribacter sp. 2307ULW6-5 TaxID=3386275 RepID=UPI0039BCFDB1
MKRMKRWVLLFLTLFSAALWAQEKRPLNVLFLIADDLTAEAVSSYGNAACQTPNIDQLAREGIRFTRAYSQYPVCGPSRASMMFGYYPSATKTYGYVSGREAVGPNRKSWPQHFKDNGYHTARVSKIYHMAVPKDIESGGHGKDDPASWTERFNSQGPEWTAAGEAELVQGNPDNTLTRKGGNVMTIVKADGGDTVHSDGKTALKASALIRENKHRPFFLAVGLVRPHVPFVAPKKYFLPYPHENIERPPQWPGDWDDIPERGINYVTSDNAKMTAVQEQKAIAGYYASVAYMDAQVGKILATLKEEGLEERTLIVFTSDHGFHLGEHRFWMKVSLHEESVRVPLIIKAPGVAPAVTHSFAELLDLYPTVAELAGLEVPNNVQGKSLVKIMKRPRSKIRNMAFSVSQGGRSFLVRTRKWAYIQYNEDGSGGAELYHMKRDPKQYTNLAVDPRCAKRLAKLQGRLLRKLEKVRTNDLR